MGPGDAHKIRIWVNQGLWKVSRSTSRLCSTSRIMNLIHPKISSQNMIQYRPKLSPPEEMKRTLAFTYKLLFKICIVFWIRYKIEIHFMINKTTLQEQNTTYSIWQLMHGNFIIWGWQINWRKNSIWLKMFLNKWMLNWVLLWEDSRLKVKNFLQSFVLPWVY